MTQVISSEKCVFFSAILERPWKFRCPGMQTQMNVKWILKQ